jgi:transcriptional regulator with XRE-family HTH domain
VRLNPSSISALERGVRKGTKNTRARLAFALDCPIEELFG